MHNYLTNCEIIVHLLVVVQKNKKRVIFYCIGMYLHVMVGQNESPNFLKLS